MFLVFYGVTTLMVAIEAVYLPDSLPLDLVVRLVVNGGITAATFAVLAVLIHGRMSGGEKPQGPSPRPVKPLDHAQSLSWTSYVWRLALVGLSWVVLFVLFGAFVFLPLAGRLAPADLAAYTNLEMPAWVLPFQALRGALWAALALPVIRMMKGRRWETGLAVALLFSVLMGAQPAEANRAARRVAGDPLCRSVWRELCFRLDRRRAVVSSSRSKRSGNGLRDYGTMIHISPHFPCLFTIPSQVCGIMK